MFVLCVTAHLISLSGEVLIVVLHVSRRMERAEQRIVVLLAIFFKCIIGMNANRLEHCKVVVVGSGEYDPIR